MRPEHYIVCHCFTLVQGDENIFQIKLDVFNQICCVKNGEYDVCTEQDVKPLLKTY